MKRGVVAGATDHRMTVVEHLEDLRRVLIIGGGAWLVATIGAFFFKDQLFALVLHPLKTILPRTNHLLDTAIFTSPTEGLTVPIKLAGAAGLIVALPVIVWQVWEFVAPGLRPAERKFAGPFIGSTLVLFACGAAFAYFIMPVGLNFLATFLSGNAVYFPDINEYLSFFLLIIVVFGVTFELPVVVILLGVVGIVSTRLLRAKRKGIWVGIILASLLVTPGADPFTPTALAVPLIGLFELSVLVLDKALHK